MFWNYWNSRSFWQVPVLSLRPKPGANFSTRVASRPEDILDSISRLQVRAHALAQTDLTARLAPSQVEVSWSEDCCGEHWAGSWDQVQKVSLSGHDSTNKGIWYWGWQRCSNMSVDKFWTVILQNLKKCYSIHKPGHWSMGSYAMRRGLYCHGGGLLLSLCHGIKKV